MSQQLLDHSPDLKKLQDEGFEVDIINGFLLIRNIPYVNKNKEIKKGVLISPLDLSGEKTVRPSNHVVLFAGEDPCNKDGSIIHGIQHQSVNRNIADGIVANLSFSNKPPNGYSDYYEKMTRYIDIISAPARSLDKRETAKTFKKIVMSNSTSPFEYRDTNSSRARINDLSDKLSEYKIGIIGLGGTGSYILDLVSKVPVKEIHLFDKDDFIQHNAFRSPGAPSLSELVKIPKKVDYFSNIYSKMHKGIHTHCEYINKENVNLLKNMDFVFVSVDNGTAKRIIFSFLEVNNIPYIDVGMGLSVNNNVLDGVLRVTCINPGDGSYVSQLINLNDTEDDAYSSNIQIADLNMFNAALAVISWKKEIGFFSSEGNLFNSHYTISSNLLSNRMKNED